MMMEKAGSSDDFSDRESFTDLSQARNFMESITLTAHSHRFQRILAIDTSSRTGVVVLANLQVGQFHSVNINPGLTHGRELVPTIQQIFRQSDTSFDQLDAVAIGIGPGSYTGLRVGMAVAKTIAEVVNKPCLAIDSLLLPVLSLKDGPSRAVSIADAQRGAIYEAIYDRNQAGHWQRTQPPQIIPWNDLNRFASDPSTMITGPGLSLAAKLGNVSCEITEEQFWQPDANSMEILLKQYLEICPEVDRYRMEPLYIRPSAAEEKRDAQSATKLFKQSESQP
jgi:tRNA threonylcarbamoyladenosine biosynthesis protein TsaB